MSATEHRTEVAKNALYNEWLAMCSCGWTGSYYDREDMSRNEAVRHLRDVARLNPDLWHEPLERP